MSTQPYKVTPIRRLGIGDRTYDAGIEARVELTAQQVAHLLATDHDVLPLFSEQPSRGDTDLSELSRDELRDLARDLGVPIGGTKDELIARLEELT